jgi:hypothetical protein
MKMTVPPFSMRIVLRILFGSAFLASLCWIHVEPRRFDPYISAILAVAALFGTFYDAQKKPANIIPRLIARRQDGDSKYSASTDYALVVQNDGEMHATDFELRLLLADGQKSPVWDSDRNPTSVVTFPIIHPKQNVEWRAVIYFRAPTEFDIIWSWKTINGVTESRKGKLKLEYLSAL